ncbi:MAG: tRNA (adenosine(37)-N6)-threonylcarbamoyltransferase complex dimerization subunit type 1 TsaB [Bacteroidales bacterium]|nr:tRNA (adenosine(37)-N6)-threonylcarbamoyltransferase complex dimerization subunit type 1 TsaB [Bacteroidales bacterium]
MILSIETSTPICSVAIAKGGEVLAIRENHEGLSHATLTAVFVEEVMKEVNLKLEDLDAVAISKGPGSYTGLRIGVSIAKGLCYALNKPLIAVSSIQALAQTATRYYDENHFYIPMIDARRMEVYSAVYDAKGDCLRDVQADIIDENSYSDFTKQPIVLLGDGAKKCEEIFKNCPQISIDETLKFSAKNMISLAQTAFENKDFVDVAYFEPFYLKDFIAGKPSVKGLK